jgi:hypothetical protein
VKPATSIAAESTPSPARSWMTVEDAARELGFAPETIRKYGAELGAYRLGRRGPWRIPAERVAFFRANPRVLTHPRTTLQELYRLVERVNLLSGERERRMAAALERMERRVAALEAAARNAELRVAA